MKDLIQEGRKIQETFKKNVISEGKWKYIDYDEGDSFPIGWSRTWEYSPSFFDMIGNFLKRRSDKLPKIKRITATLDHLYKNFVAYETVTIEIVLGNPIRIERDRPTLPVTTLGFGGIDYYGVFDSIIVTSDPPFTTFSIETRVGNKKNSDKIDDAELNKLIKKMLDELKPELQKYTA